jgi:peptide/nickel transport system ATP-binding protein
MAVLDVIDLSITIHGRQGDSRVVDDVTLSVAPGTVVGVVGETGSGKTLTAMTALGLYPSRATLGGRVSVCGIGMVPLNPRAAAAVRGRMVAVVLQNPSTSLNPVFTIGAQIAELLRTHQGLRKPREQRRAAIRYFEEVELPRPDALYDAYPHELSGGMQQRVLIAFALACRPQLIVADEPTTALDVTTQARILRMLKRVQAEHTMAMLWITHDLSVAAQIADRIAVLYAGAVVETGPTRAVLTAPRHPYTQALIASLPARGRSVRDLAGLPGDMPNPAALPTGCRFHPRCPHRMERCVVEVPRDYRVTPDHVAACFLVDEPALARGGGGRR